MEIPPLSEPQINLGKNGNVEEDSLTPTSLPKVGALNLPRYYCPAPTAATASSSIATTVGTPAATTSDPRPLSVLSRKHIMISKRRKELFGDCALIEIIHLHDCLRGALKVLQEDVTALTQQIFQDFNKEENNTHQQERKQPFMTTAIDLERRVTGRFKVIWSVFRAHSSAEDEFIWPALRSKMQKSPVMVSSNSNSSTATTQLSSTQVMQQQQQQAYCATNTPKTCGCGLGQEEYEEDHADEERMFSEMDTLLTRLRRHINSSDVIPSKSSSTDAPPAVSAVKNKNDTEGANVVARKISECTRVLADHLMRHLEKEEMQCMPLVVKHLSKAEIHDLVGNIMGRRSAETIAQIMTMAVQSLAENERQEMIQYMKQSMQNTFFDRWLNASGWGEPRKPTKNNNNNNNINEPSSSDTVTATDTKPVAMDHICEFCVTGATAGEKRCAEIDPSAVVDHGVKRPRSTSCASSCASHPDTTAETVGCSNDPDEEALSTQAQTSSLNYYDHRHHNEPVSVSSFSHRPVQITSQAELEKLIRAIVTNPALSAKQKNATIQGLRDSVWKSNQREKQRQQEPDSPPVVAVNAPANTVGPLPLLPQQHQTLMASSNNNGEAQQRVPRAGLPPFAYYKRTGDSTVELIWKNDGISPRPGASATDPVANGQVPLFSAAELAPTFHDGAAGAVLGCPHYGRACKLRHPKSGRLYTCRICCDQARELPVNRGSQGQHEEKLDRYAVTEVMCMICNTLQPAEDRCINPDCESRGRPFAKYFCRICHLYDDGTRPIFHCPYCNICRLGLGLGIDFRHCMRCNACVSLDDKDHQCIPQKLQGTCPICHDTLFQSTEPLRGIKCGHVMHLACFTQYRRTSYTCPLCMRSMEDMKDHFALLDAAIRMQPMPATFLYTMSNIYCQDCCKTGQTPYHFVGQKCPHCSSYNTRELGRVHNAPLTI